MTRQVTVGLLTLLALYGLVEAWPLIRGPKLLIESPADHATIEGNVLTVRGRALRAAIFTINGSPVLYDQEGDFSSTMTFPPGGSILTLRASDRFGRTVSQTRTIFIP